MEQGAREILNHLEADTLRLDHPSFLFADLADAISALMGGTSGILLELFFCKAGTHLLSLTAEEGGIGYMRNWQMRSVREFPPYPFMAEQDGDLTRCVVPSYPLWRQS